MNLNQSQDDILILSLGTKTNTVYDLKVVIKKRNNDDNYDYEIICNGKNNNNINIRMNDCNFEKNYTNLKLNFLDNLEIDNEIFSSTPNTQDQTSSNETEEEKQKNEKNNLLNMDLKNVEYIIEDDEESPDEEFDINKIIYEKEEENKQKK